jgi:hypothetical protein
MDLRPCGHPVESALADTTFVCSRAGCRRRVSACVVYVVELAGMPIWRLDPTCHKHLKLHEDTARRVRLRTHPGIFRHPAKIDRIIEWLHADGNRCRVSEIEVHGPSSIRTTLDESGSH